MKGFINRLGVNPGNTERVILHWTGGSGIPGAADRKAYHAIISQGLSLVPGVFRPEDNRFPKQGGYAAHTKNLNTKSFGLALAGMRSAKERPFKPGPEPITKEQFNLSAKLAARILLAANLECTPKTALTHAEVQKVLGVKQNNKWDIAILPWRTDIAGASSVGRHWRQLIKQEMREMAKRPWWVELFAAITKLFGGGK